MVPIPGCAVELAQPTLLPEVEAKSSPDVETTGGNEDFGKRIQGAINEKRDGHSPSVFTGIATAREKPGSAITASARGRKGLPVKASRRLKALSPRNRSSSGTVQTVRCRRIWISDTEIPFPGNA